MKHLHRVEILFEAINSALISSVSYLKPGCVGT